MRLVFMGTPEFSVPALDAVLGAGHEIASVYTRAPRPAGRGKRHRPCPVQVRADALGLPVHTPGNFRSADTCGRFRAHQADAAVVVAYGLILPESVLAAPRLGCLNIHASLLPRWRGAAPIHRAVMSGDNETGISIMAMDAGLDTGPVLLRRAMPIKPDDTTGRLHDRLAQLGARTIVDALDRIDDLEPEAQAKDGVSYARKVDKAETRIDWSRPAVEIDRHIRGLSPFPGAWCEIHGERTKLLDSRLVEGDGEPGAHLGGCRIACGAGAIEMTEVQRAGRRPVSGEEFLRGIRTPARFA
ncbi:MAG: methionyl-tRNA formyltransferase [Boseongicola sp. SB0667_bin_21]|nr:methionyl-tRNA formyltransferase [Boseongicola sp. SB0667_bin_21]